MNEPEPWWKDPRGIVSAITILTMVLGFFYVRERQMWEHGARISAVEARGEKAVVKVDERLTKLESSLTDLKDRIVELEHKFDSPQGVNADKERSGMQE